MRYFCMLLSCKTSKGFISLIFSLGKMIRAIYRMANSFATGI